VEKAIIFMVAFFINEGINTACNKKMPISKSRMIKEF